MKKTVTRLIGTVVLVFLSVGISMGGITRADSRKSTAPHGASGANAIQELLDYIYQCRDCGGDREGRRGDSNLASIGVGGIYAALIMELWSAPDSTQRIWLATSPAGARGSTASGGAGQLLQPRSSDAGAPQTIAYLGGISDSFVSSTAGAFRGRGKGGDRGSQQFGHKPGSLAAVPEPAPIFLLGTILLATFSIARLRFNR